MYADSREPRGMCHHAYPTCLLHSKATKCSLEDATQGLKAQEDSVCWALEAVFPGSQVLRGGLSPLVQLPICCSFPYCRPNRARPFLSSSALARVLFNLHQLVQHLSRHPQRLVHGDLRQRQAGSSRRVQVASLARTRQAVGVAADGGAVRRGLLAVAVGLMGAAAAVAVDRRRRGAGRGGPDYACLLAHLLEDLLEQLGKGAGFAGA